MGGSKRTARDPATPRPRTPRRGPRTDPREELHVRGTQPDRRAGWPRPTDPSLSVRANHLVHKLVEPNPLYRRLARWLERHPAPYRAFTAAEKQVKTRVFGCRMCGQCALPATAYACPMSCPKQLRNGPCGGVSPEGDCEVYPGMPCVWVVAYERAEASGSTDDLTRLQRPIDQREWGRSSWVNYWQGRDDGLWTDPGAPSTTVHRVPLELGPTRYAS